MAKNTKKNLIDLLEMKRKELKESSSKFGRRLGLPGKGAYYGIIRRGERPFPAEKLPVVAQLLGITQEEALCMERRRQRDPYELNEEQFSPKWGRILRKEVDAKDIRKFLAVVEAAEKPLPLAFLLKLL